MNKYSRKDLDDFEFAQQFTDPWDAQLEGGSFWDDDDLKEMCRPPTKKWYLHGADKRMWPSWLREIRTRARRRPKKA